MPNLVNGLGGSAGFGENFLARNDDGSSTAIDIRSVFEGGLNFFGTTYTSLYVNNNGNITFGSPSAAYSAFGLNGATSIPIIAPMFDDIDTRGGAQAATAGGTSTGSNLVYWDLDAANGTFTATWDDVGYFPSGTDRLNAYQLQLVKTSATSFNIIFRYEDINDSTGGRAGFSNGTGTTGSFFELPQSGNDSAMLQLEATAGNTGQVGIWQFQVQNGVVTTPTVPTTPTTTVTLTPGTDQAAPTGNAVFVASNGTINPTDVIVGGGTTDILSLRGGGSYDLRTVARFEGIEQVTIDDTAARVILRDGVSTPLAGGAGNDTVYGSTVTDSIFGAGGGDAIAGYDGNDLLSGGAGDDSIWGESGNDTINGDDGNDVLVGGTASDQGSDSIAGGEGSDTLFGGGGADILVGGGGNDVILGEGGNDTMSGGAGADRYYVSSDSGNDVITDFSAAEDMIDLYHFHFGSFAAFQAQSTVTTEAGNLKITFAQGASVTLMGVTALSQDWVLI